MSGGGSATPSPTALIPGAFKETDPGYTVNVSTSSASCPSAIQLTPPPDLLQLQQLYRARSSSVELRKLLGRRRRRLDLDHNQGRQHHNGQADDHEHHRKAHYTDDLDDQGYHDNDYAALGGMHCRQVRPVRREWLDGLHHLCQRKHVFEEQRLLQPMLVMTRLSWGQDRSWSVSLGMS